MGGMKATISKGIATKALALLLASLAITSCRPAPGKILENWEVRNSAFRIGVTAYQEKYEGIVPGAYYVFRSALNGSDLWREVMVFRHDDPVPIPRNQVRFEGGQIGYVFMGWKYAVTTDGGGTWSAWDAAKDLPNWKCCNYRLIREVHIDAAGGSGTMTLDPIPGRAGEVPKLCTKDYGKSWSGTCN